MKHILATSVLIFHDAFPGIIVNKTSGKYKGPSNHPLNQRILSIPSEFFSDQTFEKWKKEVIDSFNEKNWLGINIDKVGSGSSKRYVDRFFFVSVMDKQGDAIGRLRHTLKNSSKQIKIISTTMVGMGDDVHNVENKWNIMQVNSTRSINVLRLVFSTICHIHKLWFSFCGTFILSYYF